MQNSEGDPPRAKKISVIAVHGVGDHPPFATAREVGDLLSNLEYRPSEVTRGARRRNPYPPRYSSFTEVTKRIDVRPVRLEAARGGWRSRGPNGAFNWANPDLEHWTWGPMDAMEKASFNGTARPPRSDDPDNDPNSLDHLFMKGQLYKYKGEKPEDTYQCLRLEGKRIPDPNPGSSRDTAAAESEHLREEGVRLPNPASDTEEKTVHVYEMYWADLSQTASAFTRIFGELYQLLFHLGSVSVNNVEAAAIHFYGYDDAKLRSRWHAFSGAQRVAAAMLAWPVPILNLLMAAIVPVVMLISLMRTHLSVRGEFIAMDVLLAVLLTAAAGYVLRKLPAFPGYLYPLPLPVAGVLAVVAGLRLPPLPKDYTEAIVAAAALAFALGGVWLIVRAYDRRRPGTDAIALSIAGIVVVACLVIFLAAGFPAGGQGADYPVIAVCLNIFEVVIGLLGVSWVLFYISFVWAHFAGRRAVMAVPAGADRVKAARTRWTAQLILALSSIAFLTLTVSIWTGVETLTLKVLPGEPCTVKDGSYLEDGCAPVKYRPVSAVLYRATLESRLRNVTVPRIVTMRSDAERYVSSPPLVTEWAGQMLTLSGIAVLPFYLIALLIALLITVWAIFPSVLDELNPPKDPSNDASLSLGVWLDRGFRFMRWGGEILYWSFWLPALLVLAFNFRLIDVIYNNQGIFDETIAIVGTVVAGAAVGVVGFSGRLKTFAGGLRPILRVMLDVDNWLREHPRDSNPTARICGRYVSLLRHISAWRDSDGSGYDAVIIVAHSQGTVVTADLMRFLRAERLEAGSMANYDPELEHFAEMPVYFLTMGCPLHQLYGLRFPYLYGWARNDVRCEELEPGRVPDIGPDDAPRPERLGVERWINAYRSGDYIGRYLWRGGRGGYEWTPATTRYDQDWDPPAGKPDKVSADRAGKRIEFCIGPGAHTHYFDHTAEAIAEVLDRMINNATKARTP